MMLGDYLAANSRGPYCRITWQQQGKAWNSPLDSSLAVYVYPATSEQRVGLYSLADYAVSSSVSGGGLVLVRRANARVLDTLVRQYGFELYSVTGTVRHYVCRVLGRGSVVVHYWLDNDQWAWRGSHLGDCAEGLGMPNLEKYLHSQATID